ncbi:MAG TPA: glycosyltransferase family 4 protein, partial [Thermoflexia bacterium]|nr:glycosyltransferase family 4 protein [Thermoflexia bacterium]
AIASGFPAERTALVPIPFDPPEVPSPQQVDAVRQRYGLGRDPYLLFVGDITYSKGVYDLLEAYSHWRPAHPEVRLVFAGVNREGRQFLQQVRQTAGATFLGHIPHRDVLALMRGAEIVVLPSRSEGLPRVILEAVAMSTRVLCPPSIPEFGRHLPEFVLPEVSPEAIVETLEAVWNHEAVPSYPLSAHEVDRVVARLAEVYREVMRDVRRGTP